MGKETMTDDAELLRRYSEQRSDAAFAELVGRHVDMVHTAALRQMQGDPHRAREVTQLVFVSLARKASALVGHPVLPAWLHRACRLAALDLIRKEARRHRYEKAAAADEVLASPAQEPPSWDVVGPVLDGAINELDERDRQAILLRFFANKPFAEIGQRLRLSENAARMRVERALDKLQEKLSRRGITSTSAALAAALSAQAVIAAPSGVAAVSVSAALAGGGAASAAWIALMSTSKLPLALTAAVAIGGAATLTLQKTSGQRVQDEISLLRAENAAAADLEGQNRDLQRSAAHAASLQGLDSSVAILRAQVRALDAGSAAASRKAPDPKPRIKILSMTASELTYDVSKLDVAPHPVMQVPPVYPDAVRSSATPTGTVVVDFYVGSDGQVYSPTVASSDNIELSDSAVNAVTQWTFKPGAVGGKDVVTHMQVPIVFTLNKDGPPPATSATWF